MPDLAKPNHAPTRQTMPQDSEAMTNVPSESDSLSQFSAATNGSMIPLPPGWTVPQFQFGQGVDSTEGSGEIIGLEYIYESKPAAALLGAGWQYIIDTSQQVFSVEMLPESQAWEVDET